MYASGAQEAGLDKVFQEKGDVIYRKKLWSSAHVDHAFTWQRKYFTEDRSEVDAIFRSLGNVKWHWTYVPVRARPLLRRALIGMSMRFSGTRTRSCTRIPARP